MHYYLVFLGSARESTPPSPARLGLRVARACVQLLEADGARVELIDPLAIELGCLPVSAMIHVPKAQEALDEGGRFREDPDRWAGYFGRNLGQLSWWAEAAAGHRDNRDPAEVSPAFQRAPDQRNAPSAG